MSVIRRLPRPHQYTKSGFVVLGVVFGQPPTLLDGLHAAMAWVAFCCAAGSVRVFNDMVDADADRMHPIKRQRPIAIGAVSPALACRLSALLAALFHRNRRHPDCALRIAPSVWLLPSGLMLTLCLGFARRRAEWIRLQGAGRLDRATGCRTPTWRPPRPAGCWSA